MLNYVNLAYYNASAIDKKFHLPEDIARKHNCCVIAIDSDNYVVTMAILVMKLTAYQKF